MLHRVLGEVGRAAVGPPAASAAAGLLAAPQLLRQVRRQGPTYGPRQLPAPPLGLRVPLLAPALRRCACCSTRCAELIAAI